MKLQVYQSYWGMAGLPFNGDEEWSMEEKLEKIAEGGFDGVEFLMEEKAHRDAMVPLCDGWDSSVQILSSRGRRRSLTTISRRPKTAARRISTCSPCPCRAG